MKKIYRVLIIEDESMIIVNYENALTYVQENADDIQFKIDIAKDCKVAYDKINEGIIGTPYDLVFLDIRLPSSLSDTVKSGDGLGLMIRKKMPSAKIIVLTSYFEPSRLNTIMNTLRPDSFAVKNDLNGFKDLITIIEKVIDHKNFFSNRILSLIKQQALNKGVLDDLDVKILLEISNGAKMKELLELLPLSKSGIEKRRSLIKERFGDKGMSDRDMILAAKERDFI